MRKQAGQEIPPDPRYRFLVVRGEGVDVGVAVAQRLAEIEPDDVLAHTSLSVLYQKKGMIPEAEAEGAKARVLGWKQQLRKQP